MIVGSCHCGAVRVEVPRPPESLTNCNCSICRRTGALWAYYATSEVRVTAGAGATEGYEWGDRTLRLVRCATCGCVTHWEPLPGNTGGKMGINARNFEPALLDTVRIRRLDGASSWTYLD